MTLIALLLSLIGLILFAPAAHAAAAPALPQAQVTIDGVTVTVMSPVLPARQFSAPLPDQASQQAIMTSISPYREISILAVPLGTVAPFDGIAATSAITYRQALATVRQGQRAVPLKAPTASLFGQQTPGYGARVDLPLHGTHLEPAVLVEWVSEAGERIWVVRIVVEAAFAQMHSGGVQGFVGALASVRLTSTSLGAPSTLLQALHAHGGSIGRPAATSTSTGPRPAQAPTPAVTLPFPSWWNGNCDVNAHGSPTSFLLGDSYEGMPACGPRPGPDANNNPFDPCAPYCDYPEHFFSGAWGEDEWECVELVMRYMYLAYGVNPYQADGFAVVAKYSGTTLTKVTNGSGQSPVPGDVISFNTADPGHTALVASSTVSNGNGTIYVLQQNFGGSGYGNYNDLMPMTVSGGVLQDENGLHATGWLHSGTSVLPPRIAVLDNTGTVSVKEGALNAQWSTQWGEPWTTVPATAVSLTTCTLNGTTNPRIAVLDNTGTVSVKEGALNAHWSTVWGPPNNAAATAVFVDGCRIAVLDNTGTVSVKEGALNAQWSTQWGQPWTSVPATAVALTTCTLNGTDYPRIAVLDNTGTVSVKEGALNAHWTTEWAPPSALATGVSVYDCRIGVLDNTGTVSVKDGALNAQWSTIWGQPWTTVPAIAVAQQQ